MATPIIGEIKLFAGNFAPRGYMFCNGALLSIAENETLFALIGTTYGGDGQATFALPDLRDRIPIGVGQGPGLASRTLGESLGTETVTLTPNQLPSHNHVVRARAVTADTTAANAVWAISDVRFGNGAANASMNAQSLSSSGQSQPHNNLQPVLGLNFIIAVEGVFPSRN